MKNIMRITVVATILIILGIGAWKFTQPVSAKKPQIKESTIYLVAAVKPKIKSVPKMIVEVGNVQAQNEIKIIPQVTGILKKIHFSAGQKVTKGQLLFEINPEIYSSQVDQAKANLQRDEAQLNILKATAQRYASLAKLEYVTRQQSEEAQAAALAQEAVVLSNKAQLKQQLIQLSYTKIRAPFSGKAGDINANPGDLITANSATPLVIINQLDNVLVNFNVPQDRLADLFHYQQKGALKVEVLTENGGQLLGVGEVNFINNSVSPVTGMLQLKARVANANLTLWPGQLVMVRLILTMQPNAIVIPSSSVQLGQQGHFVYLVKDGKALIQPVKISSQLDKEVVVTEGLQGNEEIIELIPPGLEENSAVKIENSLPQQSTVK